MPSTLKEKEEFSFSSEALAEVLEAVVAKSASFRFKVRGFSMTPFIQDGDIVTISPWVENSDGLGEVVAFIHPASRKLAIHRIIDRQAGDYLIKGDNIFKIDGLVPKENILGRVTRIERKGRFATLGLGPERILISFLSRMKFFSLILGVWRLLPFPLRSLIKCRVLS